MNSLKSIGTTPDLDSFAYTKELKACASGYAGALSVARKKFRKDKVDLPPYNIITRTICYLSSPQHKLTLDLDRRYFQRSLNNLVSRDSARKQLNKFP